MLTVQGTIRTKFIVFDFDFLQAVVAERLVAFGTLMFAPENGELAQAVVTVGHVDRVCLTTGRRRIWLAAAV